MRTRAMELIESAIDFGKVVSTSIGDAANSVIIRLQGDRPGDDDETGDDEDDSIEEMDAESWGEPNLLSRPLDPNDDGECEALFNRGSATREVIGFRDRRYQAALEQGEALLRNIVSDATKRISVLLGQDGTLTATAKKAVIASDDVRLTGANPTDAMALASKCNDELDSIKAALDALANGVPGSMDGGLALQNAFKVAWPGTPPASPTDVGSTKVKAE